MPSVLLPVAVGPTIATSVGRVVTVRRLHGRAQAPPARQASTTGRSAATASAGSSSRIFVVVKGDREERAVVRILGWKRHCGIRSGEGVEGRVVECTDIRRPQDLELGDP